MSEFRPLATMLNPTKFNEQLVICRQWALEDPGRVHLATRDDNPERSEAARFVVAEMAQAHATKIHEEQMIMSSRQYLKSWLLSAGAFAWSLLVPFLGHDYLKEEDGKKMEKRLDDLEKHRTDSEASHLPSEPAPQTPSAGATQSGYSSPPSAKSGAQTPTPEETSTPARPVKGQ